MSEAADGQWLEGVAGRSAGESRDGREGAALRAALGALPEAAPLDPPARSAAREAQLLARARAAGLWPTRAAQPPLAAMAAALLLVAAGVAWYVQTRPAAPLTRAVAEPAQRLEVAAPRAAQQQLIAALRHAGIEAHGYQMLGRYGVDADLPQPLPEAVRAALAQQQVAAPAHGALRVEFTTPGAP